jgi:hypothetical protein
MIRLDWPGAQRVKVVRDESEQKTMVEQSQTPEEFVAQGTLLMDGNTYQHGERITLSDPERIAELRAAHAIATPFEVTPPEQLQAQHEQVVSENADLRARLAELEAQINGAPSDAEADATPKSNG